MEKDEEEQNTGDTPQVSVVSNRFLRGLLFVAGTVFLAIGVIGIVVPLLPTTPFLLLAAACYSRSSVRFYNWLLNHRWVGKYIRDYRENRGIPLKAKASAIALLWISIISSAILFVRDDYVRLILILIAAGVTVFLVRMPTLKVDEKS